jgi:hypothetical protein
MKRWFVVTPEFSYTEYIVAGQGPSYAVRDVIEIEAETARDAISLGVREMLRGRTFTYCEDQRSEGLCPYTGVFAEPAGPDVTEGR